MILTRRTFGALAAASVVGMTLAGGAGHAQQSGGTMAACNLARLPKLLAA